MKPYLQCAEQQVSRSNLTKYCACHAERLAYLVLITYETSFTVRGATGVTIQPHQILRLPRKMTRLLYRPHIWNVISNARSNRCHYPTSPNTAPATKNDTARCQRKSPKTGETSFPMRGRSDHDPSMIRAWSDHENANRNPPRKWACFSRSPEAFSIVKYNVSPPILHSNLHQILRLPQKDTLDLHQVLHLPRKVTLEPHEIPRLPHKMTRMLDRRHIWNLISNARSNRYHDPTSPNTAPATQNDSHAWSSSHMKPHFQCAEQQVSRSNLTKYCAWHEQWHCKISKKISKNRWNVISNAGPIRPWSEHDPSMIRPWKRKPQPASQVSLLFEVPRSIFYCKIQRFAPNLTFKPSPNTAPTTKRYTWPSPSAAPATKSDTWTSRNTAPATQNDSHAWSSSHMKPHFQCAEQQVSRSNLTKYCACHTKWLACLIVVTYETSFPMRGATGITIQPHQILRLARTMTLQDFKENLQKQMKRHFQCGADPTMIRAWSEHDPTMKTQTATRLASELAFRGPQKHFLL